MKDTSGFSNESQLHGVSDRFFFWRSVGGIVRHDGRWRSIFGGGSCGRVVAEDGTQRCVGRSFARSDHRVAQMMDHFTQYVGSSPYASPAVLCGIAHMQTEEGIWYPIGGTRAVPEALGKLAAELGVDIRVGTDVMQITTQRRSGSRRGHRRRQRDCL